MAGLIELGLVVVLVLIVFTVLYADKPPEDP